MTVTILECSADSYISDIASTTNYGTHDDMYSGENNTTTNLYRALFKFIGLSDGTIPTSAVIDSAILKLTFAMDRTSNTRVKNVYRVKVAWVEEQCTWNIYSTGNNWQTAGCAGANDRESTGIGGLSIDATPSGDYLWTLTTSAIQEIVTGTWTNNGFAMITETEANDMIGFNTRNFATAESRPKLTVTWHLPTNTQTIII